MNGATDDDAPFEDALAILSGCAPEYGGGLSNHGPMAADALVTLGFAERAPAWAAAYRERLERAPPDGAPIAPEGRRAALGRSGRYPDWVATFAREIERLGPSAAIAAATPQLAPGLAGAAAHGVIRVGHAARALARRETAPRRRELAEGLAYWASRYWELPGARAPTASGADVASAVTRVPTLHPGASAPDGFITDGLAVLAQFRPFAGAADLADVSGDPARVLSDLILEFARVYLATGAARPIAFVHAVTGPAALRPLLPHLEPAAAQAALRAAWHTGAALLAAFGRRDGSAAAHSGARLPDRAGLAARAVENGDEHAIKFAATCLSEHALRPHPDLLCAAADAVERIGEAGWSARYDRGVDRCT